MVLEHQCLDGGLFDLVRVGPEKMGAELYLFNSKVTNCMDGNLETGCICFLHQLPQRFGGNVPHSMFL